MTSSEGPHDGDSSPARSGSDPDNGAPRSTPRRPTLAERKAAARDRARRGTTAARDRDSAPGGVSSRPADATAEPTSRRDAPAPRSTDSGQVSRRDRPTNPGVPTSAPAATDTPDSGLGKPGAGPPPGDSSVGAERAGGYGAKDSGRPNAANAGEPDAGSAAGDPAGSRGGAGADTAVSGLDVNGGGVRHGAAQPGAGRAVDDPARGFGGAARGPGDQETAVGSGHESGAGVRSGRSTEPRNTAAPTRIEPRSARAGREEGGGFAGLGDLTDRAPSPRLKTAVTLLAVGAVALTAGAILPVSPDAGPGYLSWPLLALLALVPAGVANAAAYSGRHGLAAGLTVGLAALAPGRLVLDFQFFAHASKTIRPELFLPDRLLDRSAVGAGFWLLVAGHVVTIVAGVVAARVAREVNEVAGEDDGRRRWRLVVPLLAVVSAVGLLMAPVVSDNPYLPAYSAFEGPGVALAGYVVVAGALLLAVVLGVGAAADGVVRGTLGGVAAATFALALPAVVGGLAVGGLHLAFGPVMAIVAMLVVLFLAPRTTPQQARAERTDFAGEARVPSLTLWRGVTALAALLTAVAAAIGALAPQLDARLATESPARWLLLAAAILVVLPTPFLFKYKAARGLVAVLWAGVVLAGTAVLSTALTASAATGLGGGLGGAITYRLGAGAVFTAIALGLAGLTALAAVVTGVVERDDEGTEDPRPRVLLPVVAAAVLAVAAFGTPVFSAPDYATPGLWSDFDTPSWGLLTAVLVVLGVLALSVRSRPGAAAAALAGATLLLALHVSQLFFVDLPGRSPALGFWLGVAAVVATATAAATAAAGAKTPAGVRSHTA